MELLKKNINELNKSYKKLRKHKEFQETDFSVTSDSHLYDFYGSKNNLELCRNQVDLFFKKPTHRSMHYDNVINQEIGHQNFIGHANKIAQELGSRPTKKPRSAMLVVLGAGSGGHIPELLKHLDYHTIVIVEPNLDILSLLLNNLDICRLKEENKNLRDIYFIIQSKMSSFKIELNNILKNSGYNSLSDVSLFRHYNTDLFDEIYNNFKSWRNDLASMWGFFEDEILSIKHTLENSKSHRFDGHFMLCNEVIETLPIIVGNGASLDSEISLLKKYHKNNIIVSCGTSLTTLLKNGIVPDIHVEVERTLLTYTLKAETLNDRRLKNTLLIGLNTLAPKMLSCFNYHLIFAKAHDSGTLLINDLYEAIPLFHCNPTVTNLAAAALNRIGLKKQILVGCDYGYLNMANHHSKHSDYYNKKSQLNDVKYSQDIKVIGNFTPFVFSNRIYNGARLSIENLLRNEKGLQIYNTSNGAKVEGAIPVKLDDVINKNSNQRKSELLIELKNKAQLVKKEKIQLNFLCLERQRVEIKKIRDKIEQCTSMSSLMNVIEQKAKHLEKNNTTTKLLLLGSLKYISTTISGHINRIPEENIETYFQKIKPLLVQNFNHYLNQLKIKESNEI